jgi:transcriptional regulator with GAF, ATPase, and Fis domain
MRLKAANSTSAGRRCEAAESGRRFVDDVLTQGRYGARESIAMLRLRSFACVPLVHAGRVLGVVYSDGRQPSRVLDEGERALLEDFARCAAVAIANARRHGELSSRVSRLEAENHDLQRQIERRHRFANIRGDSPAMQKLFITLEKVSATAVNVLIQGRPGPAGTHRARHPSQRSLATDLVTVNAGAIPESLLERTSVTRRAVYRCAGRSARLKRRRTAALCSWTRWERRRLRYR